MPPWGVIAQREALPRDVRRRWMPRRSGACALATVEARARLRLRLTLALYRLVDGRPLPLSLRETGLRVAGMGYWCSQLERRREDGLPA